MTLRILAPWAIDATRLVVLFTGLLILTSDNVFAATTTARSCNAADVQAAVSAASNGDTIVVPSGTCTWTTNVSIKGKAIKVQGASKGSVTIVDRVPDGTYMFDIQESTAGHVELMNLTFDSRGAAHGSGWPTFHVSITGVPGGRAILIHDNAHLFATGGGVNAYHAAVNRGVIYNNSITAQMPGPATGYRNTFSAIRCKNPADQAGWESPSTMGTLDTTGEKNLYFEDNTVRMLHEGTDFDDACRIVFRHNTLDNTSVQSHGWDSSPLGSRQVEVYGNTFLFGETDASGIQVNIGQLIHIRGGGVWAIHNNIIPDANTGSNWGNPAEYNIQLYGLRQDLCYNGSYPMPRQHGLGHNGSSYIREPIYIWGNNQPGGLPTPNPAVSDIGDACGNNRSTLEFVQLNRDYFLAPKPGYATFPYPHPLRSGTQSGSGSTGSQLPAPPTNVRIIG